MNIVNLFLEASEAYPNQKAIIEKNKEITFATLSKEVQETALYFQNKGIQKGDRVLVFIPMSIDLYRTVLALFYIGATAVFLDEWVNKKRLDICCEIAQCKGFIAGTKVRLLALFSKELRKIPVKLNPNKREYGTLAPLDLIGDTPALITFTTGSTGTPKAALRSHVFLNEQFKALLHEIQPKPTDIDMPILPIVLFVNLGVGCTSIIADYKQTKPNNLDPKKIINQLIKNNVSRITASPFFIKRLAEFSVENRIKLPKLEKLFTGGAPVFPSEAKLYCNAFPDTDSIIAYGSTEAEPISSISAKTLSQNETLDSGLPVGQLYPNAEVRIIKSTEEVITLSENESLENYSFSNGSIGEIIVSGHHVLAAYFNNQKAFNRNKIIEYNKIWHRTGDSGFIKNGELYLTGRCAQLISKNGKLISPFIIENQLQQIMGVTMGTMLEINSKIAIILESKMGEKELLLLLKSFEFDEIKLIEKIPRDPRHNSKIDYGKLKLILTT